MKFSIIDTKNYLDADHVYAFLSVDENGEGLIAAGDKGGGLLPLIFTDIKKVEQLKEGVKQMLKVTGKKARLVKFSKREIIEELE